MNSLSGLALLACLALSAAVDIDPEVAAPALSIIERWGYKGEVHTIVTEDGWELDAHRIPQGHDEATPSPNKKVVIFQHGLECSSDNWILGLPDRSAGFVFADAGYDVWLVNSRGNRYTRLQNHTRDDTEYWTYTWDQMQDIDLPATFDYIEQVTGQKKFYFVGHSQGTVIMFAKLAWDPAFADRVERFFAIGPGTTGYHMETSLGLACHTDKFQVFQAIWQATLWSEFGGFLFNPDAVAFLANLTCTGSSIDNKYCDTIFDVLTGFSATTNISRIPVYVSHIPAGSSVANLYQHCNGVNYDTFTWFNYSTPAENLAAYGKTTPPEYDLTKVRGKIHLYSSYDDKITTRIDLETHVLKLVPSEYIVEDVIVPHFSHMDFLWSDEATEKVFNPIISTIAGDQ